MFPKVSIIVPVYNVERYLERCMQSLTNQTLKDIEIVLVDDGSPDNCPALCDEYAQKDCRIKVIHKKNEGLGYARNSGLEVATGEFIAFVDSDDYVETTMYEELYKEAKTEDLDVIFCNFYFHEKNGEITARKEVDNNESFCTKDAILSYLLNMIGSSPSCKYDRKYSMSVWHGLYKNKIIQDNIIRFPSERKMISEDIIFHINYLYESNRIRHINKCFYYYCENESSLTKTYRKDRYDKIKAVQKEIIRMMTELYPETGDKITLSADRFLIGYTRNMLLSFKCDIEEIKTVLNDAYLLQVISRYPYKKLPAKYLFFTYLMKLRQANLILRLNAAV